MMLYGEKRDWVDMLIKACSICGNRTYDEVLSFKTGYMSDGLNSEFPLVKEECKKCGTIRTKAGFDWKNFYENEYSPSRKIDTLVIDNDIEKTRSDFIYEWISSLFTTIDHETFSSLLEIGCGQGHLLDKFKIKDKFGIEPSLEASAKASEKGEIRNIGYEKIDDNERYDLLLSYCVIEHIENLDLFLMKQKNILNKNGCMVIALPIQDKFNYDLFFMDHLYHFSHEIFQKLLNKHGFEVLTYELGKGSYSNIGLYICAHSKNINVPLFEFQKNKNLENIKSMLDNVNEVITKYGKASCYAFGYGEIAKTVMPYTKLRECIITYIDDFAHGDNIISSQMAKKIFIQKKQVINIILLVNPQHKDKIMDIFKDNINIHYIDIFQGIEIE